MPYHRGRGGNTGNFTEGGKTETPPLNPKRLSSIPSRKPKAIPTSGV